MTSEGGNDTFLVGLKKIDLKLMWIQFRCLMEVMDLLIEYIKVVQQVRVWRIRYFIRYLKVKEDSDCSVGCNRTNGRYSQH